MFKHLDQDYIVREGLNCKVMETGKIFNVFGYGFAFNYASLDFIPFSQVRVFMRVERRLCSYTLTGRIF